MEMPDVQEAILSAKTILRPTTIPHVVRAASQLPRFDSFLQLGV